ncbi:MAG: fatty acid desaturase [Granulosicoccus sp.]
MPDKSSAWISRLARFRRANNRLASYELLVTVVPFVGLWICMQALLHVSVWFSLLLAVPTACLLLRVFIIQHDCGHGSMFSSNRVNNNIGRCLGILTLTPYDYWRRSHAGHHASSGNLDRRGIGDIDTLTVTEYGNLGLLGKLRYRMYRHPIVMFVLGPTYLFVFRHRLPVGEMNKGLKPWMSVIGTNLSILVVFSAVIYFVGLKNFLIVHIPVVMICASIGVWLFYIQHQYEDAHWEKEPEWSREHAALHGSSYYDLPSPIMWLTGYIGIHHVHHLSSRIPFYHLAKVLREFPELKEIQRLTFLQSLGAVRLTLWDENSKQLISFKDALQPA